MLACNLLLAIGAILLFCYVREKLKGCTLRAVLLKTSVSVTFLAVAVCAWYATAARGKPEAVGIFVILGLLFGLLGDIWLDLKYVYPAQDAVYTYAGFTVFGIGHVLYLTGMILRFCPRGKEWHAIVPILLGAVLSVGNALLEKPMKLRYGRFKPIVIAYGVLLFSTLLVSFSLALLHRWRETALNLIFAGGVLFALSDLVLSGTYFGEGKDRAVDIILNYLTYYPAQFLIAYSLLFLR